MVRTNTNNSESNLDIRPRVYTMFGYDRLFPSLWATSTLGTVEIVGGGDVNNGII